MPDSDQKANQDLGLTGVREPVALLKFSVIRQGGPIATVEAPTKRDALLLTRDRFGDGAWLMEAS